MSFTAEALGSIENDFELKMYNSNEEFQVECNRKLYPLELLQVLSNVLKMIPEKKRKLACDIALLSTKDKGDSSEKGC